MGSSSLSLSDVVLVIVLVLSLSGNVFLGWEVQALKGKVPMREAKINISLPAENATDLAEETSPLKLDLTRKNILYIFKPNCVWCGANWNAIRALYAQGNSSVNFIGISTTKVDLSGYLKQYPLPFPVYVVDDKLFLSQIDFRGTPQTLLVTPQGIIIHNWVGAYDSSTVNAISKAVGLLGPPSVTVMRN
jgi:hypothetical protein